MADADTVHITGGGVCSITASQAGDTNYNPAPNVKQTFRIAKAATTTALGVVPPSVQYSDVPTLTATVTSPAFTPTGSVRFYLQGALIGTAPLSAGEAQLTPQILVAPSAVAKSVVARYVASTNWAASASSSQPLTVTTEDARGTYTGDTSASSGSPSIVYAPVHMSATIQDITAVLADPDFDADGGNITTAKVTFVNRATGNAYPNCANLTVTLIGADPKLGTASCNTSLSAPATGNRIYTIGIIVGGRYHRNSPSENATVSVSR